MACDVHSLAGVITVAIDHGIGEGFVQGHLDVELGSIDASKLQNEAHHVFHEGRDSPDLTWERLSQLDERKGMSGSRQQRERLSVSHSCSLHFESSCHYS